MEMDELPMIEQAAANDACFCKAIMDSGVNKDNSCKYNEFIFALDYTFETFLS